MKYSSLSRLPAMVLVGAATLSLVMAFPSQAAPLTSQQGDVFLGFHTTGNGATQDYIVKLGSAANFLSGNVSGALSITGIKTDLDSAFGADWITRDDVFWGIFAANSSVSTVGGVIPGALFATKARTDLATPETGFARLAATAQASGAGSKITNMRSAYNTAGSSTTNNPVGLLQTLPTANSWASYQTNNNFTSFGSFDFALGNFGNGTTGTVLDFFYMAPATGAEVGTPGARLGAFTINNAGVLTFTPVPEPAAVSLLLAGGFAILLYGIRRRNREIEA